MGFLLNISDQREYRLIPADPDLLPRRGDQRAGPVSVIFHHAKARDLKAPFLKSPNGGCCVSCPAIDQEQIRERGKLLITVQISLEASADCLIHACVVVLQLLIPHPESAVILLQRFSILKHGHACDNPTAAKV